MTTQKRTPPGAQALICNPDARCDNCRLPLGGTCYHPPGDRGRIVCASCLAFLCGEPEPEPEPADPLERECPRCKAEVGQRCRNYKGQNKATCKERRDGT